jgi:hypothetical protein
MPTDLLDVDTGCQTNGAAKRGVGTAPQDGEAHGKAATIHVDFLQTGGVTSSRSYCGSTPPHGLDVKTCQR